MRKDHRPYWLKRLYDRLTESYVDHFVRPQFDSAGSDLRVLYPRHLSVSGPKITIGDHVHIMALPDKPVRLAVFEGLGRIAVGSYSIINPGVRISSATSIEIGHSCMFAMNAYLADANWHDINHRIYAPGATAAIVLQDNVWVGDSALITKGVTIGRNSIVGAWSVVTRDVPDNVIVAGNPASIVKQLDDSDMTMRKHLFEGELPYEAFEEAYFKDELKGNSLLSWLKTLVMPGLAD